MTLSSLTGFPGPWIEQQRRSSGSVRWAVASPESRNGREGGVCRLVDSDSRRPSVSASETKAPHSLDAVRNSAVGVAPATARYCCSRWERHLRHLWVRSFRKSLCAKCCPLSYLCAPIRDGCVFISADTHQKVKRKKMLFWPKYCDYELFFLCLRINQAKRDEQQWYFGHSGLKTEPGWPIFWPKEWLF